MLRAQFLQGILLETPGYWGGWPGQGTGPHRVLLKVPDCRGMARSGDRAPQSSPGSPRLSGDRPGQRDRAPQAVYRKCRGLRGTGRLARHGHARSAGREGSPYVYPSSLLRVLQSKPKASVSSKKSFSLLDRARPVFSFSALRKRENGGCNEPAIIMAEIHSARQGEKKPPPARRAVPLPSRPRGAVFITILSQNMQNPPTPRRILVQSHN